VLIYPLSLSLIELLYRLVPWRRVEDLWDLVCLYPDEAYRSFLRSADWKVLEDVSNSDLPDSDWIGPYTLCVPELGGKRILVFCKKGAIESAQEQVLNALGRRKQDAAKVRP
jgi:hypothetical protein